MYTCLSVSVLSCCTKVCTAVRNAVTATPASNSVAVPAPPAERPSTQLRPTPPSAPAKAANGTGPTSQVVTAGASTMTSVAAIPAPAAAPNRYGSASGLRNTPWKAAPAPASAAPTMPASSTRGTRSSQTIAASRSDSGESVPVSCAPISASTRCQPRSPEPTTTEARQTTSRPARASSTVPGRSRVVCSPSRRVVRRTERFSTIRRPRSSQRRRRRGRSRRASASTATRRRPPARSPGPPSPR